MNVATHSSLGKKNTYISQYQRDLLFPIPRKLKRDEIGIPASLPFKGVDVWNAYELSWLNTKGKPRVAVGEFIFPCESVNLIESKSFKLYLNSFNNTKFNSWVEVRQTLMQDLSVAVGAEVSVKLVLVNEFSRQDVTHFSGTCLDHLEITCDTYTVAPHFLLTEEMIVSETLYSDLLKSNCLVTGQPDWGSVQINYTGKKIQHAGLLKYIISFRNHNEFHEQCVERIFMDIIKHCAPHIISVEARYTRRGGVDINPFRSSTSMNIPINNRLSRQ